VVAVAQGASGLHQAPPLQKTRDRTARLVTTAVLAQVWPGDRTRCNPKDRTTRRTARPTPVSVETTLPDDARFSFRKAGTGRVARTWEEDFRMFLSTESIKRTPSALRGVSERVDRSAAPRK
jgi:hypothetical protein